MGIQNSRLHIKELKNKFKNYKSISVDDFNEFYKDVFGDIKKNTVSWYIYELKKKGIIKNISRGQYVLEDTKKEELNEYVVITMDIIRSSNISHLEFNQMLDEKISALNEAINKVFGINRKYNISQGDEVQILFPFSREIGELVIITLSYLYPLEVRYGISVGELNSEIKENSWEMNGPLFWNARDQLEKIKSATEYEGLIISSYSQTDQIVNNILPLVNSTLHKITEKQWEAIKYELSKSDLDITLDEIKISKTSYYERLDASNIEEILSSFNAIFKLMKTRRKIK